MVKGPKLSKDLLAQISAARARQRRMEKAGLCARSARYDQSRHRIIMELTNGCVFGFPVRDIPWLRHMAPAQLSDVEVSPGGSGLIWDAVDIDLDVAGLILSSIGRAEKAREFGRLAGSAKSAAKARAARANGAKGGRPRQVTTRSR